MKTHGNIINNSEAAVTFLVIVAAIRATGSLLAVDASGISALVIDIYAIGLLLGSLYRQSNVSPGWLALAFMFVLPLERIIQRSIGYSLQNFSAEGACFALQILFGDVECFGIRVVLENKDILVDLPGSSARTALTLFLLYAVIASFRRPSFVSAVTGGLVTMCALLFSNVVRMTLLSIGSVRPRYFHGVSFLVQPWHGIIGLFAVVLGSIPILYWASRTYHPSEKIEFPICKGAIAPSLSISH